MLSAKRTLDWTARCSPHATVCVATRMPAGTKERILFLKRASDLFDPRREEINKAGKAGGCRMTTSPSTSKGITPDSLWAFYM